MYIFFDVVWNVKLGLESRIEVWRAKILFFHWSVILFHPTRASMKKQMLTQNWWCQNILFSIYMESKDFLLEYIEYGYWTSTKVTRSAVTRVFFQEVYKLLFLNYSFVVCLHFIDAVRGNSKTRNASETDVSAAIKGWLKNAKKRSSSQQSVDSDGDDTPHESDKQNQVAKNAKKRLLSQQSVDSDGDDSPHESDKQNQVATRIESDQIGLLMRSCQRMSDLEWKTYFFWWWWW